MPPIDEKEHDKVKSDLESSRKENEDLKKEIEKFKGKPPPKDDAAKDEDDDEKKDEGLLSRTKKDQTEKSDKEGETRRLEKAIMFNVGSKEWLKTHKDLLPGEIEDIFKVSDKEKYDSSMGKANALRDAIIQSFFSVQSNLDLLTATQKVAVDEYMKLTKNGREQKSEHVFENYFEPALEMMKRVKKAEELSKSKGGLGSASSAEAAYKEKLIKLSKHYHLGEKYGS